ncbi:hypothetical protein AQUSIP_07190 [Aquicella siphonis]|uniref:Aminoglycoside (3'') (9) adenylyltransferase n=1 Tax=Aquicella siphonis TaxID=254247 RepID=A0A5E4PEL7_9COXI|nr:nucleotidyltransferase domain-containing protein [Aquicella siphonis]VVC75429.1 hypothetical protein AQUSIP_07190 [Aquicella siphonis]
MTFNYKNTGVTAYQDVNEVLLKISNGIAEIIGNNLIGLYLFGSLAYGDFNTDSSDIDLIAITKQPLNHHDLDLIKQMHKKTEAHCSKWNNRLECSYTPIDMLSHILPPKEPRPYYGGGIFYDQAPYGNEWIINNHLLYKHGISLIGPDIKELIKPVDIIEVQKACIRDLFQEWLPKMTDSEWLDNSHYQSYLVMNLCRILYTVMNGVASTKRISAEWVKNRYGSIWTHLIETAESWKYGKEMSLKNKSIEFIKFAADKVKETTLFQEMYANEIYLGQRRSDLQRITGFLDDVINWAKQNNEIIGIALVGSYARNQAKEDSDIDLVILSCKPEKYLSNNEWLKKFGKCINIKRENYGAVTSWHVSYQDGHEVEFGIASPSWADIPAEQGTKEVVTHGIVIIYDPKALFIRLITCL